MKKFDIIPLTRDEANLLHGGFGLMDLTTVSANNTNANCSNDGQGNSNTNCGLCSCGGSGGTNTKCVFYPPVNVGCIIKDPAE